MAVSGVQRYAGGAASDAYLPIYTDRPDELARELDFDPTTRFADAEIRCADDPRTFFDCEREGGVWWQSRIQTYIEMMQGDKMTRELAQPLRDQILAQGR